MIAFGQIKRLIYINRVLVRYSLDDIVLATHLFRPIRFIQHLLPWRWFRKDTRSRGERIRCALQDLGPIFVKFGQMLSTRPDLLPPDIAAELALLQDRVPPFPGERARVIIEKAFGKPVEELFAEFESEPLASASIAQVHAATLSDGRKVIVKVVRPDIEKTIARDIALLFTLAELAERYWSEGKRLRATEIVREYEKTIFDELDLQREAASASQLRRNFLNSDMLYIPEIYWPLTRNNVMVMERIYGTPISNTKELIAQGIDLVALSERGVEIFFTQVFSHNFFHADMHPGNIFVEPNGRYIAVDFGIVGTLMPEDQRYLAENFLAFFNRDYRRVAELHVESHWVPAGTRVDEFESAIRTVCEPIFERPLKDISFGQLLLRLFQTARRFHMEVQPQLVLLQKTLLNIEGLGRELNPDLDLWRTAKPFLERWMQDRVGPKAFVKNIIAKGPRWLENLPQTPDAIFDLLTQTKKYVDAQHNSRQPLTETNARQSRRHTYIAICASGLLIASMILLVSTMGSTTMHLRALTVLAWCMGFISILLMIVALPRKT